MSTEAAPVQTAQPETTATVTVNPEALAKYTEAVTSFRPPSEIARLKAQAYGAPAKAEEAKPAEPEVTETPKTTEQPEVEATETTEETAPQLKGEQQTKQGTETETQSETEQPTGDKPKEDVEEKEQSRFRFKDPIDRAIAQLARTLGIPLAEAARRVAGEAAPANTEVPNLEQSQEKATTVESIEAELASVRAEIRDKKGEGVLSTTELDELEDKRITLAAELAAAKAQAKAESKTATAVKAELSQAEFDRARTTVLQEAAKAYPDLNKKDSALFRVAQSIGQEWRDPAHPNHDKLFQPDGPRFVAEEAAKLLGIKASVTAAEAAKPVETKTAVAKPKPGPAPGSRGSAAPPPQKTQAEQAAELEAKAQAVISGKVKAGSKPARNYIM